MEDEAVPMEEAYVEEVLPPTEYPELKGKLEDAAPFWRDSRLYVRPRSYYFDRERENTQDSVAAAYGGWVAFRSGSISERLSANGTLFTTQSLPTDPERSRTYRSCTFDDFEYAALNGQQRPAPLKDIGGTIGGWYQLGVLHFWQLKF